MLRITSRIFKRSFLSTPTMAQPVQLSIPNSDKKISVPTGLFINNEFVPSVDSPERIKYVIPLDKIFTYLNLM